MVLVPADIHYVEHVTLDPAATRRMLERTHGWSFAPPAPEVGGASVAVLPSGTLCAVRAPLSQTEAPITRSYVRVLDLDATVALAESAGGKVILPPTPIEGRGRIAILSSGGAELGLWEPAEAASYAR